MQTRQVSYMCALQTAMHLLFWGSLFNYKGFNRETLGYLSGSAHIKKNIMSLNLFLFKYSFTALYCICLFKLFQFFFFLSPESFEGLRTRSCRENGQLRLPPECKRRKGGQTPQHSETSAGQVRGRMWLLLLHRGEGNHEVSVTLTILSFTPSRSLKG